MYARILAPIDGSDSGRRAFQHGHLLARAFDATFAILFVVDSDAVPETAPRADALSDLREQRDQVLTDYSKLVAPEIDVQTIEREGDPVVEITTCVDEIGADLVVAGTHRERGLSRFLHHRITEHLLETLSVPLLAVQADQPEPEAYDTIVFATDARQGSRQAQRHAIALASEFDATLHALYVVDSRLGRPPDLRTYLEEEGERATKAVAVSAAESDVTVLTELQEGRPHEEILSYADTVGADVIVVGTHGRTGLDRFVVGSVARRVVQADDRPVLAVRSDID